MSDIKFKWWKAEMWQPIPHNHLKTHFHHRKITHLVSAHFSLTLYKLISFWLLSFAFITWWHCSSEALLQPEKDESNAALIEKASAVSSFSWEPDKYCPPVKKWHHKQEWERWPRVTFIPCISVIITNTVQDGEAHYCYFRPQLKSGNFFFGGTVTHE